ncbi:MAG: flavin reductase family protein [Metallosphaera sp.]
MESSESLRYSMRRFPLGVVVVTTTWGERPVGMTVNTFNSVSLNPPTVMFIADKSKGNDLPFRESKKFAVNFVDSEEILRVFSITPVQKRFEVVKYREEEGIPVLIDSYAYITAMRREVIDVEDHAIIVGEVLEVKTIREAKPLVYYMSEYRELCL